MTLVKIEESESSTLVIEIRHGLAHALLAVAPGPGSLATTLTELGLTVAPVAPRRNELVLDAHAVARRMVEQYYLVRGAEGRLEEVRAALEGHEDVVAAYLKPPARPATLRRQQHAASPAEPPPLVTPDFTGNQGYIEAAPIGVDARFAWTIAGGRGDGVRVLDCEGNWNFQHEDLAQQCDGVVVGAVDALESDDHGTCVAGVLVGNDNGFGVTGVSPSARLACAVMNQDTSTVITTAADLLGQGDVMLLEYHRPGPFASNPPPGADSEYGYIAMEWWPDDLSAIKYAVAKGIVVVEAAGNGTQDLDNAIYETPLGTFGPNWSNPFNPANQPSGAIVVGAGLPPPGTHGRNNDTHYGYGEVYIDRARCIFSNFGQRVDCQAWGYEVTTLGVGDIENAGHNRMYTDNFAGTSSASPIVAGVAACIQGVMKSAGRSPITPEVLRAHLRTSGTPQQARNDGLPDGRIGPRPDLRLLLGNMGAER